jgi:hypothetical protein
MKRSSLMDSILHSQEYIPVSQREKERSMTDSKTSPLEIHVHLEDGRVQKFLQQDPQIAQNLLTHLQPTKLFSQKVLLMGGTDSLTAFQMSEVVRIDLIAPQTPDYPFYNGVLDIQQITPDEFQQRYHPQTFAALRQSAQAHPGEPITVFSELELVNGERLFMQVCVKMEQRLPLEQGIFVSQLFAANGLHGRRREGGVVIINPANIVRFTLYPAPPTLPPGTWEASRIIG